MRTRIIGILSTEHTEDTDHRIIGLFSLSHEQNKAPFYGTFSRHDRIKASLTSLTFLTFGKLQANLIFRSLNRKVYSAHLA